MKYTLSLLVLFFFLHAVSQEVSPCMQGKIKSLERLQQRARLDTYPKSLMDRYDVHFYFLDLNIERDTTYISGSCTFKAHLKTPSDTFCFELHDNLIIDSAVYLNRTQSYARKNHVIYVAMDTFLVATDSIELKIYYHGNASVVGGAAIGNGFTSAVSKTYGDTATYSLSEPFSAYEWFPCKQFLQDKADSAYVFVTTDLENKVGSNGILEGIDTLPNNKHRYRWKTHYPIDYYLISVAVGKYMEYVQYAKPVNAQDSIKIVNYLYNRPEVLDSVKPVLDSITMMLEQFSELFGIYPFYKEKYGHCMAPMGGGMEHQTMTTTEAVGRFTLIAHELLHQWFGDYVTCKTWGDITLNEGFASYGEYLILEKLRGAEEARNKMNEVQWLAKQDTTQTVFVSDTGNVSRLFNWELTYNKGSAIIHMLRYLLGEKNFFEGMRNFLHDYQFATASLRDLQHSLETYSGINLQPYFDQWYFGKGYPIFNIEYYQEGSKIYLRVQHRGASTATPTFKTPIDFVCKTTTGKLQIHQQITKNDEYFIVETDQKILDLQVDPDNWLLKSVESIRENQLLLLGQNPRIDTNEVVLLYPNPGYQHIQLLNIYSGWAFYRIINQEGQTVLKDSYYNHVTIPIEHLAAGNYQVLISGERQYWVKRFTKMN